ncbi:hypothetical protein CP556_25100 [Natrinema sp. CBA1119]|uniref:hypothetical protein n=1 Tax=Natrinema sp. CBA1119 TaxID=1608465 RepID=UPI000BF75310|nr:hypothetical protein [Natrinema sp. CBA1119]PGF13808.1 hypothetical protein CP556_25100 [Natrinema sp. CBA1119]
MIRTRFHRLRVRWRRWRLFRAYSKVAKIRTGCVSFIPIMCALEAMERDGHLELDDGDVEWHWPEEG